MALQPLQALQLLHQQAVALASVSEVAPVALDSWVELPAGQPRLSLQHLQQLLDTQGLNVALAQALVLDEAVRAVGLIDERI